MAYCVRCGAYIPDGQSICLACGYDPEEEKTYTARPVIELDLCMGKVKRTIEVNLTDRTAFQYPLLIGSDALTRFGALVDPSRTFIAGKPGCLNESDADE